MLDSNRIAIELFEKLEKENRVNYTRLTLQNDKAYLFEIFSYDINKLTVKEKLELRLMVTIENNNVEEIK